MLSCLKADQIGQDSAVFRYLLERNAVQNGNQSFLAEECSEFAFNPEAPPDVGRGQKSDAAVRLGEALIHLQRLADARLQDNFVEPNSHAKVLEMCTKLATNLRAVNLRVAKEDVPFAIVVRRDSFCDALRQSLFLRAIPRRVDPSRQVGDDRLVLSVNLAVALVDVRHVTVV